tara:strand:- start:1767 stop:2438 length:672 start_codon:yes stop_codon:yes gene_type:complete
MCFSATASFTSAAVLTSTGAAAMILNNDPKQRSFVALPFIFGAQQAAEGVVWLTLQNSNLYSFQLGAVIVFMFIAHALWPAWIPWAISRMEIVPRRKLYLYIGQAMGIFFAVVATYVISTGGPHSEIVGQCLNYGFEKNTASFFPPNMHAIFYFSSTVLPFFISSIRWVRRTGFLILVGLLITLSFWKYATTSVWCFFAAIASIYIWIHVYREQRGQLEETSA